MLVSRGSVEASLQLTGSVINDRTVTLTALLDGEIMAIKAREGDVVDAGRVLAELDKRLGQTEPGAKRGACYGRKYAGALD